MTSCNIYREYYVPVDFFLSVFTLSYADFARPITQVVFHLKCNQIQFSYHMDDSFSSILFDYVQHVAISRISYPSLYASYIVSVRRMVMDRIVVVKLSC